MSTIPLAEDEILPKIAHYVSTNLLDGSKSPTELSGNTPLLQLGILNSRNTGRLLAYIQEEFDVSVPPTRISGKHFMNLDSISALVAELLAT
jgi:acyl carrier protein